MPALDAGAEDIVLDDDVFEILCEPSDLTAMRAALVEAGIEVSEAQVMQRPKTLVPLDEDGATKLMKLIDTLEDLDDTDDGARELRHRRRDPRAGRRARPARRREDLQRRDRHQPAPLDLDRGRPDRPRDRPSRRPRAARACEVVEARLDLRVA